MIQLASKDNRTPDYLAVNPEGKVPTLLVDDRPMTEVAAILYYLARRFPAAGLLPEGDIEAEAQIISWMSFIAATVHPARAKGADHAREVWQLADRRLGKREWAVGGRYSIADIHLFRLFWRFRGSLKPAPDEFPNLRCTTTASCSAQRRNAVALRSAHGAVLGLVLGRAAPATRRRRTRGRRASG